VRTLRRQAFVAKTFVDRGLAHVCVPHVKLRATEAVKAAAERERERGVFEERLLSKEAGEAFKAFAEKRPPDFRKVG
jgi:hypothetical protein